MPRRRHCPVATIIEVSGLVPQTFRLMLGEFDRRRDSVNATRTHPTVVSHPIDVYPIVGRIGFDLEEDRFTPVDADVMTEALDGRIAPTVNVPLGQRIARQTIFFDDVVGGLGVAIYRFETHISSPSTFTHSCCILTRHCR